MRPAQPVEQAVGMEYYVSDTDGTGGRLRQSPADFRVEEREAFKTQPVDADTGDYPHLVFRATLDNWDTNDFVNLLSNRLGISRERISWAGTKDKRAVTTQLFSIDGSSADQLPEIDDVQYEVVGRAGRPILFGDLAGNRFELVVRNPPNPAVVTETTSQLQEFAGDGEGKTQGMVGVPNYFGQQRFGSKRPVTHKVGLAIVRGDWEEAVLQYVGNPSEREPEETQKARQLVDETRDWKQALESFPNHLRYERSMLHRLVENDETPEDYREALETLPTNLQRLFVNAAQSYIFNRILSRRMEAGLPFDRPVPGDIVCFADSDAPDDLLLPDTDRLQRVTEKRVKSVRRHCARGRAFVTTPLVGTETEFADGQPGEITKNVLDDVDIEPSDFSLPGEFDSTGTRRAILVRTSLDIERDPLTLSFSLPKGSYATVLLREYLKTDPGEL